MYHSKQKVLYVARATHATKRRQCVHWYKHVHFRCQTDEKKDEERKASPNSVVETRITGVITYWAGSMASAGRTSGWQVSQRAHASPHGGCGRVCGTIDTPVVTVSGGTSAPTLKLTSMKKPV